jgi:hypothetical protein
MWNYKEPLMDEVFKNRSMKNYSSNTQSSTQLQVVTLYKHVPKDGKQRTEDGCSMVLPYVATHL